MDFERRFAFQMHKIIFFSRKPEKILGFTSIFGYGQVTLNTGIFLFGLMCLNCTVPQQIVFLHSKF